MYLGCRFQWEVSQKSLVLLRGALRVAVGQRKRGPVGEGSRMLKICDMCMHMCADLEGVELAVGEEPISVLVAHPEDSGECSDAFGL